MIGDCKFSQAESSGPALSDRALTARRKLELVLRRELELAHRSRSGDPTECRRGNRHRRCIPVWMVQRIERLETNRQLVSFIEGHPKYFVERSVKFGEPRPCKAA